MRNSIPDILTRMDVDVALSSLRAELADIAAGPHASDRYDLIWAGNRFPPKVVISRAIELKTGEALPLIEFSGGEGRGQAIQVLRRLQFQIVGKSESLPAENLQDAFPGNFGEVPGYPEGSWFPDRRTVFDAHLHRRTRAGIAGRSADGAESIVLSGGYADDEDFGDEIIYTGEGGRDSSTGQQIFDQTLTKGNLALARSHTEGIPIRVIRGYGHKSEFSPSSGYRYDGLYRVAEYWQETGKSGFTIWRFRLLKETGTSADAPDVNTLTIPAGNPNPVRMVATTLRLVRDTAVSKTVKAMYDHRCQVCNLRIDTPAGPYAEGAHIRPLGRPHNGSDTVSNVLCLCPNHHVLFDNFGFTLSDDFQLIGLSKIFNVHPDHNIDVESIRYHREHRFKDPLAR